MFLIFKSIIYSILNIYHYKIKSFNNNKTKYSNQQYTVIFFLKASTSYQVFKHPQKIITLFPIHIQPLYLLTSSKSIDIHCLGSPTCHQTDFGIIFIKYINNLPSKIFSNFCRISFLNMGNNWFDGLFTANLTPNLSNPFLIDEPFYSGAYLYFHTNYFP